MATKQVSITVDEQIIAAIERISGGNRSAGFERAARAYLLTSAARSMTADEEQQLADFDATCEEWRNGA
ncbi:hypothetical protein [Nocardia seriolae]|nr:hypothetical protein [Nocardia seriolae]MTJ65869.1 hypothetical protein [Nocardia seriolae]MTJ72339.1 hypothetical protein [Nocardia seriolae]MTJ86202.1 hypothetical protein [Nocardia seriolae]MTK30198.1 hypothetical protein [Nocardia seriolae]MTK43866.1 hypothetical protein [Nocardia seriolae]